MPSSTSPVSLAESQAAIAAAAAEVRAADAVRSQAVQQNPFQNGSMAPSARVPGTLQDVRPLTTTKKDKAGNATGPESIWAYSIKVLAIGNTFEFTTRNKDVAEKVMAVGIGAFVVVIAGFEVFNGNLRLTFQRLENV